MCHDGILSTAGLLATEELYFPFHDMGGTAWYDPGFKSAPGAASSSTPDVQTQAKNNFGSKTLADWRKWSPDEHLSNWATPQLVIHSEKDYRITMADGLAAFNILQARGVESQFLTFPDENHFVLKPENSLVWHKVRPIVSLCYQVEVITDLFFYRYRPCLTGSTNTSVCHLSQNRILMVRTFGAVLGRKENRSWRWKGKGRLRRRSFVSICRLVASGRSIFSGVFFPPCWLCCASML